MKSEKIIRITFITLVILIMVVIGIITLTNNNELSLKEGRRLTTFPKMTLSSLKDENFYTTLTSAYADQLAFREDLVKLYYLANLQRYNGDVVKGENNQLFLSPLITEDKDGYKEELKATISNDMNNIAKQVTDEGAKFIFLSVPRKDVVMEKYLPSSYLKGTEDYLEYINIVKENLSENVAFLDAYEIFKEKEDEIYDVYYKTDHHLNIRGGYYIFEKIIDIINNDGYNINVGKLEDEYDIQKEIINGSYNRKIGQSVAVEAEELILTPKLKNFEYTRTDMGKESFKKIFGTGNTYADAYMGGDFAETIVDTNIDDEPNILYVGSSYTNVLESLSCYKFNKMVSIDYRDNNTGKSIVEYVKEHDIDYVVFICSQSTNALAVGSIKEHLGL